MKEILLTLACTLLLFSCSGSRKAASPSVDSEIRRVMNEQEKAWNEGNLDGFMQGYMNSEKLRFIGKSGLNHGWQKTLDNYKKSYPDKAAMGKLTFDIISIEQIGKRNAFVIGKWRLDREKDVLEGHYTLLWEKIAGEWKIVADHSS